MATNTKRKKQTSINKNSINLQDAVEMISMENSIDKSEVVETLKVVIAEELAEVLNIFDDSIKVAVDENLEMKVFILKEVVEKIEDVDLEITEAEAKAIQQDGKLGDTLECPLDFSKLARKVIRHLDNLLTSKLKDIRTEIIYREYKSKEGELINGVFLRNNGRDIFIDIGKTEALLPYREQSFNEHYRQGDRIKSYIKEVTLDSYNHLRVILSRRDPNLVSKLFELEVAEIMDGIVEIKKIVRESGKKTKIAVASNKIGVEPVGACVGVSGVRIKNIIKELWGERIDVIPYNANINEYISKAMQPAIIVHVLIINEEAKEAMVIVTDDSYALALGREGVNIKLASLLTEWEISVRKESQIKKQPEIMKIFSKAEDLFSNMDSDLTQLTDIDEETIVKLMNAGIMMIADLYEKNVAELVKIEGITQEKAELIRKTLDEMVEVVEDEDAVEKSKKAYLSEVEDELEDYSGKEEELTEEFKQVEYLICPACSFEFEYIDQTHCPSCKVEFEFESEDD